MTTLGLSASSIAFMIHIPSVQFLRQKQTKTKKASQTWIFQKSVLRASGIDEQRHCGVHQSWLLHTSPQVPVGLFCLMRRSSWFQLYPGNKYFCRRRLPQKEGARSASRLDPSVLQTVSPITSCVVHKNSAHSSFTKPLGASRKTKGFFSMPRPMKKRFSIG